jgi:hypothetical protein
MKKIQTQNAVKAMKAAEKEAGKLTTKACKALWRRKHTASMKANAPVRITAKLATDSDPDVSIKRTRGAPLTVEQRAAKKVKALKRIQRQAVVRTVTKAVKAPEKKERQAHGQSSRSFVPTQAYGSHEGKKYSGKDDGQACNRCTSSLCKVGSKTYCKRSC